MGYIYVVFALILLVPIIFFLSRRSKVGGEGEKPVGKAVMTTEPSADAPTPDASSIQKNTGVAQRHTPPA